MEARYSRNAGLIDQDKLDNIMVIGAGSIGSTVIQDLAMMGWKKIHIMDMDIIDEHNLSTSRYIESEVGDDKVGASSDAIFLINKEIEVNRYFMSLEDYLELHKTLPADIVIICTDNMASRKLAYDTWRKSSTRKIFVDVRMSALVIQRVIATRDHDNYYKYLLTDEDIPDAPCALKHTVFTTSIAAGLSVGGVFGTLFNRPTFDYIYLGLNPMILQTGKLIAEVNDEKHLC